MIESGRRVITVREQNQLLVVGIFELDAGDRAVGDFAAVEAQPFAGQHDLVAAVAIDIDDTTIVDVPSSMARFSVVIFSSISVMAPDKFASAECIPASTEKFCPR
jgi:hypothetical protein